MCLFSKIYFFTNTNMSKQFERLSEKPKERIFDPIDIRHAVDKENEPEVAIEKGSKATLAFANYQAEALKRSEEIRKNLPDDYPAKKVMLETHKKLEQLAKKIA